MKREIKTVVYFILGKSQNDDCAIAMEGLPKPEALPIQEEQESQMSDSESCAVKHDAYVFDGALDEKQPDAVPVSWNQILPSGETILERQMRMLYRAGICNFVLAMEEFSQEKAEELERAVRLRMPAELSLRCIPLTETIRDMQRVLPKEEPNGSAILIPGHAVYDQNYADMLVQAENGSAFLSKSAVNRAYAKRFARIDFKYVRELGNEEAGVSWFPSLPIFKLDAGRGAVLETAGAEPVCMIEKQVDQLELKPAFDRECYVRLPENTSSLKTAFAEVLARDYKSRLLEEKRAAAAELSEWLEKLQVRRPLLICDQAGRPAPVADVLELSSVCFAQAEIEDGEISAQAVKKLLRICREEKCDSVISVGGVSAAYAAKLLRVCCVFDTEPAEKMQLRRAERYFPHVSIPVTGAAVPVDAEKDIRVFGIEEIHSMYMIPELTILDSALMEPAAEEEQLLTETEAEVTRKSPRGGIIYWAKKVLHPFPPVRSRVQHIYKRAIFTWCRHRHEMRNQAIIFSSFQGEQANCNPRGLYEAIRSMPEYNGFQYIWAVKSPKKHGDLKSNPDTNVVKYGSRAHLRGLATSRYIVDNVRLPSYIKLYPEQVYIQTWHGKPVKHIGQDVIRKTAAGKGAKENRKIYSHEARMISCLCVPSAAFIPFFTSAYNLKELGRESIIRETGYPRNDYLFRYTEKDVLRTKLALGIPLRKKVVLYAPTWRPTSYEKGTGYIYHSTVDFEELHRQLGDEYVIIFRAHINEAKSVDFSALKDFVLDMTEVPDVNDLLIVSDLLISDYSGIIFDYANLHRPIVLYQYDRDEYVNDLTGVYFSLDELPGRVVEDQSMLAEAVREELKNFRYDEKYQRFNEVYNTLDGEDCGKRTAKALIAPDFLKTERQQKQEQRLNFYQRCVNISTGYLRRIGLRRNENDKKLLSFKGKHKGERCFLVGNGPSLRLEDLESIRNEYSFACNKIFNSFDRTNWRPTYYCFTDKVFESELDGIRSSFSGTLFSNNTFIKKKYSQYQIVCAHSLKKDEYAVHGNMLEYYIPSNATVMTFMLELAMYMGFSEIYLIGVDCSNSFLQTNDHFMSGYMTDEMEKVEQRRTRNLAKGNRKMSFEELGQYRVDRSMEAYRKLRIYADEHQIKVYNATRGGYLEAFERVNLDDIKFKAEADKAL